MATGELPEQGKACLGAAIAELPPAALRFVQGALTPGRMLDAISEGADLLDATYALVVSKACLHALLTKPECHETPPDFPITTVARIWRY